MVNNKWNITSDFTKFIGIWLGNGCIMKSHNKIIGI